MKLLITLVPHHKSDKVIKIMNQLNLDVHFVLNAFGTAPNEVIEILNLDDTRRDCVFSIIPEDQSENVIKTLNEKLSLFKAGEGVSFAVGLNSISKNTLKFVQSLGGNTNETK